VNPLDDTVTFFDETYVLPFFNKIIRVSEKAEGGSGFFYKNENLPQSIKPRKSTFFIFKNLKFQPDL
jgi:hypothetical protein